MPKIKVTEKDLSWYYRQRDPSALTVYMPILASTGPQEPTLCNASNFKSTYGSRSLGVAGDISYDMAASFIDAGLNVLVHRVVPTGSESATVVLVTGKLAARVKSPGAGGNNYSIKCSRIGTTGAKYRFYVKNTLGISVILTVDFADNKSPEYYTLVNRNSDFIEFIHPSDIGEAPETPTTIVLDGTETFVTGDPVTGYIEFSGGTNYTAGATSDNIISDVVSAIDSVGFFEDVSDPYQYSFDIAVDGGFNDLDAKDSVSTLSEVDNAFKLLVERTGSAIYLTSGVAGMAAESFFSYCNNFNSSYCAGYGPWGQAQFVSNGNTANLPGYYALLISWANSIAAGNPVWMAPAGVKRSQLGTFYRKPEYEIGKTTLNTWQNQEDIGSEITYKVNPIMKLKQYGYCIYGNSTLQSGSNDFSSMLQSFSVRVLANQIKKQAFDISLGLQFDQLTNDLFVQFKTLLGVYMDQLQYGGALYDYEIVADYSLMTDAQLNTKTVPVTIRISPNPAAENFEISLEISQAGVSFADGTEETEVA